jgi:hypothetical protein
MAALIPIFVTDRVFVLLNIPTINIVLCSLAAASILMEHRIAKALVQKKFDFGGELRMLKQIDAYKKRQSSPKMYGRVFLLFWIVYIIPFGKTLFLIGTLTIAVFMLYPLRQLVKYYEGIREIIQGNPKWLYVNHVVAIGCSIPLYLYCTSSLPAFIAMYSCCYLKYIFENKYARHICSTMGYSG